MIRSIHRLAGLAAAIVLIVVSLTGAILSVFPVVAADRTAQPLNAGALIEAVQLSVPGAEQITVDDNGAMTAVRFGAEGLEQLRINPANGEVLGPVTANGVELWFENLHRALFLSDTGHIVVLIATAAMIALSISGLFLAARRLGGWRKLLSRDRGAGAGKLHLKLARFAVVGLLISSVSGLWMGASTLGLIPEVAPYPDWPTSVSTGLSPASELPALTAIPGGEIRAITLPRTGLPDQAYLVETDAGAGYVDPGTGEMLTWADRDGWSRVMDVMHLLHTGQGASFLGLILGLASLGGVGLSATGGLIWLDGKTRRRRDSVANAPAHLANVVILVGSEGGSTWVYARALAKRLTAGGTPAHVAALNDYTAASYATAKSIVIMAATYGDGDAPASGARFLAELAGQSKLPKAPVSIVGFGDSSYPAFCAFAGQIAQAVHDRGWKQQLEAVKIDRQAPQQLEDWARDYSEVTGFDVTGFTDDLPARQTTHLRLVSKQVYGEHAQAPTAVLRFARPRPSLTDRLLSRGFAGYRAGDLLQVVPDGDTRSRAYSLASGSRDGFIEICVRKQPGGLCSSQLLALEPGDSIEAAVQVNPTFHSDPGKSPLILIGAGAGIGALAGFIRDNRRRRPTALYFGFRNRQDGLPYEDELTQWQKDGRLAALDLALSRGSKPRYVQQALLDDADRLTDLIAQGARVMVCGGREMGAGVRDALDRILTRGGSSLSALRQEGRYVEDVF
ncbi:PepSY domain-containing protein [Pseudoprimorskyibacter insulae]|uniref:NADPH--hemoprotein reductase n=1 Tax=Pseudoprimorskyibacter insulae TaxID=1695997 RepID=A0A2R8AW49_9RHOB|nr:PepSY domain-containing protein [Pseudoprimorskyibacter insulae]SPF80253.1 Sulfite reductase [NADPH] flavoprotein alpha-component [Pseudoprimorskyibacter insulae]